jgi:hypothetical protein
MKSILGIAILLAVTATAGATVRVFVTTSSDGYGLNESQNAFRPTFDQGLFDYGHDFYNSYLGPGSTGNPATCHGFSVSNFPPETAPSGTLAEPVEILPNDWAYIWFQFQDEPKTAKINGLVVDITGPAGFSTTYYLQDDTNGEPPRQRWDGTATAPGYPEWHNNPQTVVAITANGLVNGSDDPQMMFDNQSGTTYRTGVALLGAINNIGAGTYNINITDIAYATPPNPTVAGGVFHMVPEPASALLLGLVSLLIRRR